MFLFRNTAEYLTDRRRRSRLVKKKTTNVTAFRRKKWNLNIGVVIFGVVFIYLVITVLLYLTGSHVTAYEVREGSILKDNAYTGLIIRSETVILAEAEGYVNYFAPEGSKVGAKTYVYSVSSQKLDFSSGGGDASAELSPEEEETLLIRMQDFAENFQDGRFSDVYSLKNNLDFILENRSNQSRQTRLKELLSADQKDVKGYRAGEPGVVIYSTDGYENIAASDVTCEMISNRKYEPSDVENNSMVKPGDPVYKVITDDTWSLAIELDDETAQQLTGTEQIRVQFLKDHETGTADFAVYNTEDGNLGFLTFTSSMVRYAEDRFLDIELILEDESGLKIPKSSVVKKDFYVVPDAYLTQGGDSKETGVLVAKDNGDAQFKKTDIYYRDNEKGLVYLDPGVFPENVLLKKTDSDETLRLREKKSLRGVYNINKGYAVFREVSILCESDEYYIVEAGSNYGLANYDHIALVGNDVRENDVVF